MRTILHISDVHFGPPHRAEVAEGVLALVAERRPDLVVISGDLTQRAKPAQFREARRFVDRIGPPVVVVPGNHDVPMYRFWERIFTPYGAYRRWFDAELEPAWSDDELIVVGVNTAHGWTIENGRLGRRGLERAVRRLRQAPPELCRIVVAHHQLAPPPRFGHQDVLRGARRAVEGFAAAGVELVLSGHKHQGYSCGSEEFYPSVPGSFTIAHSGTTTSSRGRGFERGRNSCYWVRIEADRIHLSHLVWRPESEGFVERVGAFRPRARAGAAP